MPFNGLGTGAMEDSTGASLPIAETTGPDDQPRTLINIAAAPTGR
jgi:hypothetical protein